MSFDPTFSDPHASAETSIVSDDLLRRIRSRAAGYDASNSFFAEDLVELREAGYTKILSLAPESL